MPVNIVIKRIQGNKCYPKLRPADTTVVPSEIRIVLWLLHCTWLAHDFNAQNLPEALSSTNYHV